MIIKKIYLKNFKGIKDKKIINFNHNTSLLTGSNGFGKTTIFDALELCLTGIIHRTIKKESVTNHNKDYKKLFFQNDKKEDVIVKLWLEKRDKCKTEQLIITKYLPHEEEKRNYKRGRKHKPQDFYIFETYKDQPETFNDDTFKPDESSRLSQKDIDHFFEFNTNIGIKDVYNLFNYLQQEETTYFFKKSENERRKSLGFLFNTMDKENQEQKISLSINKLNNISMSLDSKINEHKDKMDVQKVKYKRLFPSKEFSFDKEDIFTENNIETSKEMKQIYLNELKMLSKFVMRFSPIEYIKMKNVKFINQKIADNKFIDYYILQNLLQDNKFNSLQREYHLLKSTDKLNAFILKLHLDKYEAYKTINKNLHDFNDFLKTNDFKKQLKELQKFVKNLMPEKNERLKSLMISRDEAKSTMNKTQNLLSEIIQLRNDLKSKIENYTGKDDHNKTCPYCGFLWETYEDMVNNFKKQEDHFKTLLNDQSTKRVDLDDEIINDFIIPISKKMKTYIKNHQLVDEKIIELLGKLKDRQFDFNDLHQYSLNNIEWKEIKSYEKLKEDLDKLTNTLETKTTVSNKLFEKLMEFSAISFDNDINEIHNIISNKELNNFILDNLSKQISLTHLHKKSENLKIFLEESKVKFEYDNAKVEDSGSLYEKYFDSSKDKFQKLNIDKIDSKKNYINYAFSQSQSTMLDVFYDRKKRLDKVISKMRMVRESLNDTIQSHKNEMANNIKIPFYIYSAKILQNYQQGMGVFLSTKENSDIIRFITDSSSDHDAIHHLSSGQLAVTSIAFVLAINKTYNISKNLKFLNIDDPIQEMDSINIHSFIELIRNEFLDDYQLIFSTHNNSNAAFMKYKFEKFSPKEVSLIDVQSEFFY